MKSRSGISSFGKSHVNITYCLYNPFCKKVTRKKSKNEFFNLEKLSKFLGFSQAKEKKKKKVSERAAAA